MMETKSKQRNLKAGKRLLEEYRRKKAEGKGEGKEKKAAASESNNVLPKQISKSQQSASSRSSDATDTKILGSEICSGESAALPISESKISKVSFQRPFESPELVRHKEGLQSSIVHSAHSNRNSIQDNGSGNKIISSYSQVTEEPSLAILAEVQSSSSLKGQQFKRRDDPELQFSNNSASKNDVQFRNTEVGDMITPGDDFSSRGAFNSSNVHSHEKIISDDRLRNSLLEKELVNGHSFIKTMPTESLRQAMPSLSNSNFQKEQPDFSNGLVNKERDKDTSEAEKFKYPEIIFDNNHKQDDLSFTSLRNSSRAESNVNIRRTRPSFLDSIHSSKPLSLETKMVGVDTSYQNEEKNVEQNGFFSVNEKKEDHQNFGGQGKFLGELELSSSQRNDDFAALEQHIEDLTQEKFALQRALEKSRTLAESLAQENSSITEAFNQQGAVVNNLNAIIERKEEEIRAQLLVLNTLKMESDNAQLECNAADERAKMLASEVISLEEKALRLRSNELKLEKQVQSLQEEISSNRRHIQSLERELADLRATIDSLQEEKKLMQSKLRNTTFSDQLDTLASKNVVEFKKDASPSTEDLDGGRGDQFSRSLDSLLFNEINGSEASTQRAHGLTVSIPADQQKMVANINTLIDELAVEKEILTRSLGEEKAESAKLRSANHELSRKLEAQTQRLELLISQNMANESRFPAPTQQSTMHEEVEYVDEGDEVVERVLGWIMKLFPGGSSKRRTSKLL